MLTFIDTPRFLISQVFAPETFPFDNGGGDRGQSVNYGVLIQITPEVEANLPEFCRDRVEAYSWHGVPEGTRGLRVRCGKVRPAVFGITAGLAAEAAAMNVELDQIIRNGEGRIAVTMGRKTKARHDQGPGTWPILRAVHVVQAELPLNSYQGFRAYTESMAPHWEYPA